MINELVLLADAIKEAGIPLPDWHGNFKELPKASVQKPCCRLEVGENGRIERIRVIPLDEVPYLRKWEISLGNSFPGFNIVPPIRIAIKERLEIMQRWTRTNIIDLALLENWCADPSSFSDRTKSDPKLRNSIDKVPFEEILPLLGDLNDLPALQLLIERLEPFRGANAATFFMNALTECIWRELKTGNDPIPLLSLLCHKGNPEKDSGNDRGAASVYLDVVHPSGSRVAHQSMMALINARLMAKELEKTAGTMGNRKDAFGQTVSPDELLVKQPPVKLPVLGNTILRSMAGDSGCQQRYGKTDAKSCPVGAAVRKKTKAALEWIKDSSRKGDTWGQAGNDEILFAYPAKLPPTPTLLVQMFGIKQGKSAAPDRFEECAARAIKRLTGLATTQDDAHLDIRLFAVRKMDHARRKVVFSRSYSKERLQKAAQEWTEGCHNLPPLRLRVWGQKTGEIIPLAMVIPFPLAVMPKIYTAWRKNSQGKEVPKCSALPVTKNGRGIPVFEGVELLLDQQQGAARARRLLGILVRHSQSLLGQVGNDIHGGAVLSNKDAISYLQEALPILGLLLHKLKIHKETYMNDLPYAVGKMLKIADELHALYCDVVRKTSGEKGSLPPQLIGNALLVSALSRPAQAIAMLAERIRPYLAWAQTNQSEKAGLSRYYLKEFATIEKALRGHPWPPRLSDEDKAQLFLGYLSAPEKTEPSKE